MLTLYSLCTLMNACGWISFATIGNILIKVSYYILILIKTYGVSLFMVNYMSISYMIVFIPINFPSVVALDKWGLQIGVQIGMILTALGLWFRVLIGQSFLFAMIGQTIMAFGQPFIYNAPTKISANWFPEGERILSTSIGAYANVLGIAIGCFVPSIFFDEKDLSDKDSAKKHSVQMNLLLAIIATVIVVLTLIFLKDKPKSIN